MLRKRKIRWLLLAVCLCVLCTSQVWAVSIQDQISHTGDKINELEEELNKADADISAYQQEQKLLEQDIADGQAKISELSSVLDQTLAEIENKKTEISDTQAELERAEEECEFQYEQMKKRIRFMYENSMDTMLTQVLESGSLSEALRRAEYFQSVVEYDREKLDEYKATMQKVAQAKEELISEKKALDVLEKEQSAQLSEIDAAVEGLKDSLRTKMLQIQSSQAMREKYAQELNEQKEYEAQLEREKAEQDRKRQEEIQKQKEELARQQEEERRRQQEEQQRQEQQNESSNGNSGDHAGTTDHSSSYAAGTGDLELLATIIYCEAGNQSYEGKLAVGSVIMNRVASRSFPNSISGVIYQSGQFSPVASGRFAQALASGAGSSCRSVAQDVLNGARNVDCLYFRVDNGLIDGLVIGDHVFY